MGKTIYQVDAFTEEAFKGNPAGVLILKEDLAPELMQNIAMEMNLSETAFVNIAKTPFSIRYFTPTVEIPLCGHATLASAHVLYNEGFVAENKTIDFRAPYGDLSITRNDKGIQMVFPKYNINTTETITNFKDLVGFTPVDCYTSDGDWVIAIAANEEAIVKATPQFDGMIKNGLGHLMITAASEREDVDFVVRCFAPISGINEDPVTGSAQCALVPVWHARTGKYEFNAEQVSERTGQLHVKLNGDKVEITGKAITVFKAEMNL